MPGVTLFESSYPFLDADEILENVLLAFVCTIDYYSSIHISLETSDILSEICVGAHPQVVCHTEVM